MWYILPFYGKIVYKSPTGNSHLEKSQTNSSYLHLDSYSGVVDIAPLQMGRKHEG